MVTLCINPQCSQPENGDDRDRCQACGSRLLLGQRFRPTAELGRGGFGRTFLAWDEAESPPQRCVIKQILRSQGSRDRDLAEAKRLAALGRHPQIPQLIAILESARDICLVQTYIAGRNLEQVLQADGVLDEAQVRSLLMALLPVLQYIHEQGIIHRDIKPDNILLPTEGPPILVDFGAARTVPTATELERTGTIIGSAGYAAPEQALGKAVPASDLYGLGITCLHVLTGEHPFDLYSVAADRWVWRDFVQTPVGDALGRVLDRLVARSLRSRYATAEAVLADLAPAGLWQPPASQSPSPLPAATWHCTQTWLTPGRTVNALALSPDGRAVATANSDHTVQLWDRQTGKVLQTLAPRLGFGAGHRDAVTAVTFHPAGDRLLTAGRDGQILPWDLATYRVQQPLRQPGWQITAIALTSDGSTLLVADVEGRISAWDLEASQRQFVLVRHAGRVNDLALSPDSTRLASVGEAGTLRLWALPSGQLLHTWTAKAPLRTVALSTRHPALITGDKTGRVMAWSLLDFAQHETLAQCEDAVTAIALSGDESWLAIGSGDGTIHLWQWASTHHRRVAVLHHGWTISDLQFAPDGKTLISTAADETVRWWQAAFAARAS